MLMPVSSLHLSRDCVEFLSCYVVLATRFPILSAIPPPPLPISPSGFSDTGACFVHVFGVMAGSRRCVNGGGRGMRYSF